LGKKLPEFLQPLVDVNKDCSSSKELSHETKTSAKQAKEEEEEDDDDEEPAIGILS